MSKFYTEFYIELLNQRGFRQVNNQRFWRNILEIMMFLSENFNLILQQVLDFITGIIKYIELYYLLKDSLKKNLLEIYLKL